ncbi:PREDICTED: transcription and mRNA export factor SUS1 [Camelina sativa]|uniref:Transcription and mRNA export factor ENY2 n=1 Tax=Camelina sativa TaxID=90675 RepID=A0ABM0TF22_CAMSA|nr:PREDICTED: transcription and mRNA export factor SUS1 [Camelina sativa]
MKHSVNRPPTPDEDDASEGFEKDEVTLREIINVKLVESGEKENLMELVRDRLVECGWKDEMRIACREHVKKKGRKDVTVDELIRVITPKGRASVPDSVKAELLNRIQNFIVSAAL